LFRQRIGLCISSGKGSHKTRELRLPKIRREMNACNSGGREQLRETSFRRCGSQRHAIEQNLLARSAEQQPAFAAFFQRFVQFFPGCFKLRSCPHVTEFVQSRELQQNIQAANKLPRSRSCIGTHVLRREAIPPCPGYLPH
jgi:hypothetical protein